MLQNCLANRRNCVLRSRPVIGLFLLLAWRRRGRRRRIGIDRRSGSRAVVCRHIQFHVREIVLHDVFVIRGAANGKAEGQTRNENDVELFHRARDSTATEWRRPNNHVFDNG